VILPRLRRFPRTANAGILRIRIGNHWAISGELEYFHIDFNNIIDDPLRWGLNAEYHF